MSGRRARADDGQLSFPDWVDDALRAAEPRPRQRPSRTETTTRARPPRRPATADGQAAFDFASPPPAASLVVASPGAVNRRLLLAATSLLLLFGLVMAYSASTAEAFFTYGSSSYVLKRQLLFAAVALTVMVVLSRVDYVIWRKLAWPVAGAVGALLIAVLVPGIGIEANGARRWFDLAGMSLQPSEFAKPAAIFLGAALALQRPKELSRFGRFGFIAGMALVPFGALILGGKDLSTTAVMVVGVVAVLVAAGCRWRHLMATAAALPLLAAVFIFSEDYRRERFLAFLDPWKDAADSGFQAIQSMASVASGQLFGVGLGDGVQKFRYLPEPSTDMIAGIIGEELGLMGLGLLIALYVLFAWAGLRIALECKEPFGKLIAAGITASIAVQALLNIAAALGLLPILGIPLPLVSCGGTSLVAVLAGVGVLLNISTNRRSFIVATPRRRTHTHSGGRHRRAHGARAGGS